MASNQLSVTEINTPDLISDSRAGNRTLNEASRAQIASSDGNRGPRRPSMNFQAPPQIRQPVPIENGQAWSVERSAVRTDRERRISIQHEHDYRSVRDDSITGTHQARFTTENVHRHNHHHSHHHHYNHHHRSDERRAREFRGVGSATTRESWEDDDQGFIVPALPMPVAVFCCILNFLVPGLGSMTAAISLLCCGDTVDMSCCDKCRSCCTVFGIGLLQLLLVAFFLVGWIWSCIWGITFIGMSAQYDDYDQNYDDEHYNEEQQYRGNNPMHHRERARRLAQQRARLPTPQVVEDQPYPGVHYDDLPTERLSRQRQSSRRSRSRISLTPSNLIYPMRASSNVTYNTPPPPYASPPPAYTTHSRSVLPSVREQP